MARSYQYQVIISEKETKKQNENNELLKTIIRELTADLEALKARITALENK